MLTLMYKQIDIFFLKLEVDRNHLLERKSRWGGEGKEGVWGGGVNRNITSL